MLKSFQVLYLASVNSHENDVRNEKYFKFHSKFLKMSLLCNKKKKVYLKQYDAVSWPFWSVTLLHQFASQQP